MVLLPFLEKWFFRRAKKNHEFFTGATRVYVLNGEEDARCAAVAAARMATRRQRKVMIKKLENITANVLQSYPDKNKRKIIAERVRSLKETLESFATRRENDGEEKKKLSAVNKEYFSCLNEGDPSVFCRRHPKLF
jgi:uncharacterized protein YydD (DUF2326 family)